MYFFPSPSKGLNTRVASLTPNFTNMAQTTYLHVLIDIFYVC